jgi:hypothetical protein
MQKKKQCGDKEKGEMEDIDIPWYVKWGIIIPTPGA